MLHYPNIRVSQFLIHEFDNNLLLDVISSSSGDNSRSQCFYSVIFYTHDREGQYTFTVGDARVLQGLNEGVKGMCIGERRRLRVPPELAVGDFDNG